MFIQRASGDFIVEVTGPNHCGPNHDSPKQFNYAVEIHWPEDALDERGFLMDNTYFKEFFSGIKTTDLSCERLIQDCVNHLFLVTQARAKSVRVRLSPFNGVSIEYLRVNKTGGNE